MIFLRGPGGVSFAFGFNSIVEASLLKPGRDAVVEDVGDRNVFTGTINFLQYFKLSRENRSPSAEAWSKGSDSNCPHSPK